MTDQTKLKSCFDRTFLELKFLADINTANIRAILKDYPIVKSIFEARIDKLKNLAKKHLKVDVLSQKLKLLKNQLKLQLRFTLRVFV